MIGSNFSEKFLGLLCGGMIFLPFVVCADEAVKSAATAKQPAQVIVSNLPVVVAPTPQVIVSNPAVAVTPPATPPKPAVPPGVIMTNLVFDAETKEYQAKSNETATFKFNFKNVSDVPVHIIGVHASCGCTAAKLPAMPWVIQPGANDELNATMNLAGKPPGSKQTKTLTIQSTNGTKTLYVTGIAAQPPAGMVEDDRKKNQELAKNDRQAVFKNDCASCHVTPALGKMGKELYTVACGICHDSEHRASMVPDILALNRPPDTNYWRAMIANGVEKPGSLMPAFAQEHGGPLKKEQIDSLVVYMTTDFPREHKPTVQIKPPAAIPAPSNQPPQASVSPGPPPPPGIPGSPQAVILPTVQPVKK